MNIKNYSLSFLFAAFGLNAYAQVVTTNPSPVSFNSTNIVITYHPYNDPANTGTGNSSTAFENYKDSIYLYTWLQSTAPNNPALDHHAVDWGSVGSTPSLKLSKQDSNDYTITIPNLTTMYHLSGLDTMADTLAVIFRTASGSPQTENIYIPVTHPKVGIANINANPLEVNVYPNPANNNVTINYSFGGRDKTTIRFVNLIGQTVMARELGQQQSGSVNLSLQAIPAGVYMLSVTNGENKVVQRFVKN